MNAVNNIEEGLAARGIGCSYDGKERERADHRKASFRGLIGLAGAETGTSLDDLLASVIVEGDRFARWARGGEPLRNTRAFYKTGGKLVPVRNGSVDSYMIEMHEDSQLEVWECDENAEPDFPIYRLPFSTITSRKRMRIIENLRPDVSLILNARTMNHDVSLELLFDLDPVSIARHRRPKRLRILNTAQGRNNALIEIAETVRDHGRMLRMRTADLFSSVLAFRSVHSSPGGQIDVRCDRLYQLGDMIRPAILAV